MSYQSRSFVAVAEFVLLFAGGALAQESGGTQKTPVHLQVDSGIPLRLYVTERVPYRVGVVVHARLIEPVWSFDRIVIPAGSTLTGNVASLEGVPKMMRTQAILEGDFTPLKRARVSFVNLTLPGGRAMPIQTEESLGLPTIYVPPRPPKTPKKQKAASGNPSKARQFLQQQMHSQVQAQANARSYGFYDLVRGPNKREWLENFLLSKLPYHPQWYRTNTRFDAVLTQPLNFGTVEIDSTELAKSRTPAASDATAQMRLLNTISSSDARVGDPMEGVLSQPLFGKEHDLVLPEGTRFAGRITLTQRARLFHRGGKLRFTIEKVNLPESIAALQGADGERSSIQPVQGQMVSVEADPKTTKVDSEGTATATESKTRLLRPAIAALVAAKSLDNDTGKQTASGSGTPNTSGRSLGGFSGFGLLGIAAARGPSSIGEALGFYGLAWSVYTNVIARGREVTFQKNTAVAIRFGTPR
jgi:hypothetical protein